MLLLLPSSGGAGIRASSGSREAVEDTCAVFLKARGCGEECVWVGVGEAPDFC
jgi:hypothetical protein